MNLLEIRNLSVFYGGIHAVKNLSIEVHQGEIVALIGANGAGKSSTLRAISGLVPTEGKIDFMGRDIAHFAPHKRVALGIGHSPEGRGVFANLTVLENLLIGAHLRVDDLKGDLEKSYNYFPILRERKDQSAGTLSGGEQQMLALARALMGRPKLLILDEPSLGLAPMVVSLIFKVIKDINEEGMTILLVEQNARMALKVSDRAYVLETGKIVMEGKGADLLESDLILKSYLGH